MVKSKKNSEEDVEEKTPPVDSDNNENEPAEKDEYSGDEKRKDQRRKEERREKNEEKKTLKENEKLKKELTEKDEEIKKIKAEEESIKDLLQRRQADFENYKKRMMKLQEDSRKFAIKDFASDIILINDDLLRAIDAASTVPEDGTTDDSHRSFVEGVTMISSRIEEAFGNYGIVEIEAMNQEFDPNFHEAVEIEMSEDADVDTVTWVHQKGFRIDDLVIRSSKVKVAKPMKPVETSNEDKALGSEKEDNIEEKSS